MSDAAVDAYKATQDLICEAISDPVKRLETLLALVNYGAAMESRGINMMFARAMAEIKADRELL